MDGIPLWRSLVSTLNGPEDEDDEDEDEEEGYCDVCKGPCQGH